MSNLWKLYLLAKASRVTPCDSICGIFTYIKVRLSKASLVLILLQMEVQPKNLDVTYLSFERGKIIFYFFASHF